jgi:pimeloyl-ACP methyl ester carboxylesterase
VKDKNSKPRELQYVKNGRYVVIPDCGHMLNMERPDDFNRILLDFLTDTAEPRY